MRGKHRGAGPPAPLTVRILTGDAGLPSGTGTQPLPPHPFGASLRIPLKRGLSGHALAEQGRRMRPSAPFVRPAYQLPQGRRRNFPRFQGFLVNAGSRVSPAAVSGPGRRPSVICHKCPSYRDSPHFPTLPPERGICLSRSLFKGLQGEMTQNISESPPLHAAGPAAGPPLPAPVPAPFADPPCPHSKDNRRQRKHGSRPFRPVFSQE